MTFRLKLWGKGVWVTQTPWDLTSCLSPSLQSSQDTAGGQEGLVPPPFSAFPPPPPPPPQNGLALDYGGSLYAAGAVQGPVEAGGVVNSAASAANSLSVQVSASSVPLCPPKSGGGRPLEGGLFIPSAQHQDRNRTEVDVE